MDFSGVSSLRFFSRTDLTALDLVFVALKNDKINVDTGEILLGFDRHVENLANVRIQ